MQTDTDSSHRYADGKIALGSKKNEIRTAGLIPAAYSGPVYWRIIQYHLIRGATDEPIKFTDSKERLERLWIDRYKMPGKDIFTSHTVFDANGRLLPEWKVPLKARWTKPGPVHVEYSPEHRSARVSERVLEAIQEMDAREHHVFPIDIARPDGSTERRYQVFFARDSILDERELDPQANGLVERSLPDGTKWYQPPSWLNWSSMDKEHFGYLSKSAVEGRNWFKGGDTNHYFAPELFEKLREFGDIFPKFFVALPIGVAR